MSPQPAYSIDFSPIGNVARTMLEGAREIRQAAYQGEQIETMRQKREINALALQEAKQKEMMLNSKMDFTKSPIYLEQPEEGKKAIKDFLTSNKLGKPTEDGGHVLSMRELQQGLNMFAINPEAFRKVTEPAKIRASQRTEQAREAMDKAKAVLDGTQTIDGKEVLQKKYDEAKAIYDASYTEFQGHVDTQEKGIARATIGRAMSKLQEIGVWDNMPKSVQQAYLTGHEMADMEMVKKATDAYEREMLKRKEYQSAGGGVIFNQAGEMRYGKPDKPTKGFAPNRNIQEYDYAVQNGYKGSYEEWKREVVKGGGNGSGKRKVQLPGIDVGVPASKSGTPGSLTSKYLNMGR